MPKYLHVVENMLAVFWRHEVAPFSVEEFFSRLTPTFYGIGGIGEVRHVWLRGIQRRRVSVVFSCIGAVSSLVLLYAPRL